MAPTTVRESRVQALGRLVGCTLFVAVCVWALGKPRASRISSLSEAKTVGWFYLGIVFFSVIALRYAWTLHRPGILTISGEGITQDLGWRSRHWAWSDIERTQIIQTAGGLVSVCMLYPRIGGRVRLFGWELSSDELQRKIDQYRPS
jgi:hypothetical protein